MGIRVVAERCVSGGTDRSLHGQRSLILTIQVQLLIVGDKELTAVCVGAAVGHGDHAPLAVLQAVHNLIIKLTICCGKDALASPPSACTSAPESPCAY